MEQGVVSIMNIWWNYTFNRKSEQEIMITTVYMDDINWDSKWAHKTSYF